MKTCLLLTGLLLGLVSCSSPSGSGERKKAVSKNAQKQLPSPVTPLPSYHVYSIPHSTNLLLVTAKYKGVLMRDKETTPILYKEPASRHWDLTPLDILQAEAILERCATEQRVVWYIVGWGIDSLEGKRQYYEHAIHPLTYYLRQYYGYCTPAGQRVVFINAFPKDKVLERHPKWQIRQVFVADGGEDYFRMHINLDTRQCFDFQRGSVAGKQSRDAYYYALADFY